ncbi:hypothetical protein [Streptomyces sp. NPDC047973]
MISHSGQPSDAPTVLGVQEPPRRRTRGTWPVRPEPREQPVRPEPFR